MAIILATIVIIALWTIIGYLAKQEDRVKTIEPSLESELSRPCPYCAVPIQASATKCRHCGSEVKPVALLSFMGIELEHQKYNEITGLVHDRKDDEAKKLLMHWFSMQESAAKSKIEAYKKETRDT